MELDLSNPAAESVATPDAVVPNQVNIPMNIQQQQPAEQPAQEAPQEATEKPEEQQGEKDATKEVAEAAGLDYDAIVGEYNQNGSISPETKTKVTEAVTKLGLPAEVVDRYFDNLNAQTELFMMKAYQHTDGPEGYQAMAEWAQTSLSDQERKVFSDLVESGDSQQSLMAVKMLYQQYKAQDATGGNRLKASTGAAPSGPMFRNQKELAEAYADPAVATSPTKQREIQERLKRSLAAGVFK